MNKNYFKWLIKSRKVSLLFFILIYIGFQLMPFTSFDSAYPKDTFIAGTNIGCILSILLTMAMPVYLFSYIHRKSSIDMFFSLPVSRKDQLITNLALTFILSYGCYFAGTTLVWLLRARGVVLLRTFVYLQLFSAFSIAVLTLFHSAVYTLTNTVFDGVVMIVAYTILPGIVAISVMSFLYSMIAGRNIPSDSLVNQIGTLLSPISMFFINTGALLEPEYSDTGFMTLYLLSMSVIAFLSVLLLRRHFINRKAERAEQLSDDILAYPFIINVYLLLVLLDLSWTVVSDSLEGLQFVYLLLFFIYIVASFIYKRSIRITFKPIALFLIFCIGTMGFAKLGWATEGFGLSSLPYNLYSEKYLCYQYRADVKLEDLSIDNSDNYEENYANVSFTLTIPTENKADYKDIIEKLEAYRKQSTSRFYNRNTGYSSVYFEVYNKKAADDYREYNDYSYTGAYAFSEAELKEISRYCDVNVYPVINKEAGSLQYSSFEEMTLKEFLDHRADHK
jgi:hypothetical protein